MSAGSGEEVSPDFIRYARGLSSTKLQQISRQGLSDQRVAFIKQELSRRQAGVSPISETEAVKRFAESRSVESIKYAERLAQAEKSGGGYFIDPKTGNPISSSEDLTKEGYIRTATETDIARGNIQESGGVFYGKEGVKDYNIEVQRVQEVAPKERFLDPRTGQTFEERQTVKFGEVQATRTPVKVYTDPRTGEPIEDVKSYIEKENIPKLPTQKKEQPKITTKKEFIELVTEPRSYDLQGLERRRKPSVVRVEGEELLFGTVGSKYSGKASEITPLDVTLLATAPATLPYTIKAFSGKTALIGTLEVADITGYATGINRVIREKGTILGKSIQASGIERGSPSTFITGAVVETASLVPATTKTELATDIAIGGVFLTNSKIIKGTGKTALGGASLWQIFSGKTVGEKGLGFLGLGTLSPDIIKTGKKIKYRLDPDFVKTKTDVTGIKYAEIDIGSQKINVRDTLSATKIIEEQPLKLEFIPSRKEVFTESIDPLKTISQEIKFKEAPRFPKTTKEQQKIIDVVKEEGAIISGSFAQETLIKDSRKFQDLDILVRNPKEFAMKLESKYPDFKVESKKITDSPLGEFEIYKVYEKKTGKQIADIDPIKFAEEGFGELYSPIEYKGIKLLPPEVRLTSKIMQQTRTLPTQKRLKVTKDIGQILGRKDLETSPSLLRGYGLSKKQQKELILQEDFFAVHGGMDIIGKGDTVKITGGDEGLFFSTPSTVKSQKIFARRSRMGIGVESKQASLRDIMKGKDLTFFGKNPQVLIEEGKLGKEFIQPHMGTSEIEVARVIPEQGIDFKIQKRIKTIVEGEPVEIATMKKVTDSSKIFGKQKALVLDSAIDARSGNLKSFDQMMASVSRRREIKKVEVAPRISLNNEIKRTENIERSISVETKFRPREIRYRQEKQPRITRRKRRRDTPITTTVREIERRIETPLRTPTIRRTPRRDIRRIDTPIRTPPRPRPEKLVTSIAKIPTTPKLNKKALKKISTYKLLVRRKGKFNVRGTGLSREEALLKGQDITLKGLSRTFKIKKAGEREVFGIEDRGLIPDERLFRGYKVRSGKPIPQQNIFIQRRKALLQTREEKKAIQQAKQLNKLISM